MIYGLSSSLLVLGGYGLVPWDVLHQGLARQTGIPIGTWSILVGLAVLLLWIPLRERPGVGRSATRSSSAARSTSCSGSSGGARHGDAPRLLRRGVVLAGIATGLYIGAGLGPGPRDGLMTGFARRTGRSLRLVRTILEAAVLLLGWLLGGTVGLVTFAYLVTIGPLAHFFVPLFTRGPGSVDAWRVRRRARLLSRGALWSRALGVVFCLPSCSLRGPALARPGWLAHACPDAASSPARPLSSRSTTRHGRRQLPAAGRGIAGVRAPRGVLLFLTGGPGSPACVGERIMQRLAPALSGYQLVLVDQRGTGAGALHCPAFQLAMGYSDLTPPPPAAVRACGASIGTEAALLGTDDVVADLDLLRHALGVERWSIDGVSYGTFVAERYALAHPGNVPRLVLDSVVPHDGVYDFGVARNARGRPGPRLRLRRRLLRRRPRRGGPRPARRPGAARPARPAEHRRPHASGSSSTSRGSCTTAAAATSPGSTASWRRRRVELRRCRRLSQGLHASALCGDWRFPGETRDRRRPPAPRCSSAPPPAPRNRARPVRPGDGDRKRQSCSNASTGRRHRRRPLPRGPQLPPVPTLLLAGSHDLSTPLEWARREAALAPRGTLVVVEGAGHGVQLRAVSDEGRRAVAAFLTG